MIHRTDRSPFQSELEGRLSGTERANQTFPPEFLSGGKDNKVTFIDISVLQLGETLRFLVSGTYIIFSCSSDYFQRWPIRVIGQKNDESV